MLDVATPNGFLFVLCSMVVLEIWAVRWIGLRLLCDKQITRFLLASLVLRMFLGIWLFAVSFWRWPILQSLQYTKGFWMFGLDSKVYHYYGVLIADAWRNATQVPDPELGVEYFAVVAALYRWLGAHPLYPIVLNAFFAVISAVMAYWIGRRMAGLQTARLSALLVAFWPSTFIWSAQLLKDSFSWMLLLATLMILANYLSSLDRSFFFGGRKRLSGLAALIPILIVLAKVRFYLGSAIVLAIVVVGLPYAAWALWRGRRLPALRMAGFAVFIVSLTLISRRIDTLKMISPKHPELGHISLAKRSWKQGKLDEAIKEFRSAILLNNQLDEAYFGLAAVQIEKGVLTDALETYEIYLHGDELRRHKVKGVVDRLKEQQEQASALKRKEGSRSTQKPFQNINPNVQGGAEAPVAVLADNPLRHEVMRLSSQLFFAQPAQVIRPAELHVSSQDTVIDNMEAITEEAHRALSEAYPQRINELRRGFVSTGGHSLMDPEVLVRNPKELARYLPRALVIGFLAPFPWQWLDIRGSTGVMRGLASIEMFIFYLLLPGLWLSVLRTWRRRDAAAAFLFVFILATAAGVSLVVANLGTLFRLRLLFLLPLLILAAVGGPVQGWKRIISAIWRLRSTTLRITGASGQAGPLPVSAKGKT